MILKEIITAACGIGLGLGCCIGGVSNAYDAIVYDRAVNDPGFMYLVDEFGDPVSQEVN